MMNPWQLWVDAWDDPVAKWVIMIFMLTCLILGAVYVAKLFRDLAVEGGKISSSAIADISDFEKSYAEGKISFEEYQKLKRAVPKYVVSEFGADGQNESSQAILSKKDKAVLDRAIMEQIQKNQDNPGLPLDDIEKENGNRS